MTRLSVLFEYKSSLQSVISLPNLSRNTLIELNKVSKEIDIQIQKILDIEDIGNIGGK